MVEHPTPAWWPALVGDAGPLARADARWLLDWDDEPAPLTLRLGELACAFADHADELSPADRARSLTAVEHAVAGANAAEADAMATGFLEALLGAWDRGFDLRAHWPLVGPTSRAYCLAWNRFTGHPSPEWMRQ